MNDLPTSPTRRPAAIGLQALRRAFHAPRRGGGLELRTSLAALVLLICSCAGAGDDQRPNVILVTLDTTRADAIGVYGRPGIQTPYFDSLAGEGTVFEVAQSASAVTPVSHATILTGLYPYGHRLRILLGAGGYRLPEDVPTLASVLAERGYHTAHVGSAFPVSSFYGFDRGFARFDDVEVSPRIDDSGARWAVEEGQRRSDDTTDRVLEILEDLEEPYFLWIHYWDPHDPTLVPPPSKLPPGIRPNADGYYRQSRALYDAEVRFVDEQFGRVIDAVRSRGEWDRTGVIVTADHGEGLADGLARHGWAAHRILYEEQTRVPLIVKPPGGRPARGRVAAVVRTADIAPTVYDWIDIAPPTALDGASLRPLMEGASDAPRLAYAEQQNRWDQNARMVERRPQAAFLHSLIDWPFKVIYRAAFPERTELYDLAADPGETRNLFAQRREDAARLLLELGRRPGFLLTPPAPSAGEALSPAERAAAASFLEKLGYAGAQGAAAAATDWEGWDPRTGERREQPDPGRGVLPAYLGFRRR